MEKLINWAFARMTIILIFGIVLAFTGIAFAFSPTITVSFVMLATLILTDIVMYQALKHRDKETSNEEDLIDER